MSLLQLVEYLRAAGIALLLTVLIETPIVAAAGRFAGRAWLVGVLVNMLTNPVAFWLVCYLQSAVPAYYGGIGWTAVAVVELAVVVVEWRLLKWALGWSGRRALIVSTIANSVSFGAGLVLQSMGLI